MDRRTLIIATAAGLAAAGLTAACSGTMTHDSPTSPTTVTDASSASFSAASPTVVAQLVGHGGSGCPAVAPFNVPINLVVRVDGGVNVFVTQIRMQFTDPSRIEMPQVTLPAPAVTQQFGTNLVTARSARTFPLNLPVGCGTDRKGTAVILIDTRDEHGRIGSGRVSVAVR